MKTLFAQRPRFHPWGIAVAVALVAGYLTLMGEAILCQYFLQDHEAHHHTSSRALNHTTHCLMANHSAIADIHPVSSAGFNPLQLLNLELIPDPESTGFAEIASNTSRAPPSVSAVV